MRQSLKVLGDIRTSDQVIRLNVVKDGGDPVTEDEHRPSGELWEGRGAYIHEWSHYLQFSATPLGIVLSKLRRESFVYLMQTAGLMNDAPMPKAHHVNANKPASEEFEAYIRTLEFLRSVWNPWPENWFCQLGTSSNRVGHVEVTPSGLRVNLEEGTGVFTLPLGPQQIFEAWAWLEEQIHNRLMDVDIDYRPENLLYTWPVHLVIGIMGTPYVEGRKASVFLDLIGLLLAASFYDTFAWSYDPFNKCKIGELLLKKDTRIARVIYQLFRNYAVYDSALHQETIQDFGVAFENYLTGNGLPALREALADLRGVVEGFIQKEEQSFRSHHVSKQGRFNLIDGNLRSEIDQLKVTAKNLAAMDDNLYKVIIDPYTNAELFEPPLCAEFNGRFYDWKIYTDIFKWKDRDFDDDFRRLYLRQGGFTFLEHIVHQVMFSEHIACYGSPYWPHPLENCDFVKECVQLSGKAGIEFCKEPHWKGLVAGHLAALAETFANESKYEGVPGLDATTFADCVSQAEKAMHEQRKDPAVDGMAK
jgi:hypothetical protein